MRHNYLNCNNVPKQFHDGGASAGTPHLSMLTVPAGHGSVDTPADGRQPKQGSFGMLDIELVLAVFGVVLAMLQLTLVLGRHL